MLTGRVIGRATATAKHPSLDGWRLLLVQTLDIKGNAEGFPELVIDQLGCGKGDTVLLTSDGAAVREMVGVNNTPVRWATLGVIDR
ncbi:MAG: EutN/CcmL family microcompartment protein [Planctomycetes bacterium]|nr:EutN/CcmL family microcompartment protein [Planctomycetota bacterium]MCH9727437.1 EutN/CcmL family microcompartment protein [Planctomycetota bacterium]MCH9775942.1 EutN/CcmL family microcompartment protein [Planctomycetota bacterium]MCH9792967.1 EutN/CcmL family microcompartment protein [Planctomycetota bacterium]MDF1744546.1 EutN/CcmL family microcompartment protein [Gimesia sp.]